MSRVSREVVEPEWDTDRVLTLPNVLSGIRLLAVPVFGWLIIAGHDLVAVGMLVVFGATDWFDGFLARKLKQRTELGAKLDPLADRLYILAAVVALVVRGILPWWLLAVLLARDALLLTLLPSLRRSGRWVVPVRFVGKAATMALLVAFPLVLLGAPQGVNWQWAWWLGWVLAGLGTLLYWMAGLAYVRDTVALSRQRRGIEP